MDISFLLDKTILVAILFVVSLGVAAYSTYFERKVAAFMQDRVGPDRAGPFGLLQPLADGAKFFFKEEIIPNASDKFLFILGPSLAMLTSLMTSVVIPWGLPLQLGDRIFDLQVVDINIGVLYVFGVVSLGTYGILIGGWASNNKYSLLGAIRASSQMISYELAMGMSVVAIIMFTGSLSLRDIVDGQTGWHWNILYQPLGFIIFIVCAFAECNRTPFDLPECETELVGGYHTEYSSMKLGLYLFAEYVNMFISSAVISCLYFGGYHLPGLNYAQFDPNIAAAISVVVMLAKTFFFIFFFMWIRWTIPRFRYDQLMKLGWQILIPLAIFNILATGAVMTFFNT
ncbi:MAG TPA: NADH-quinone oxidoreductase subunit NuoH [Luteibaculaceae bacterium]|nr:NADH-quinone oxidoreductase subunit NuoH [Luteibaculaceae bacterium]